MAWPVKAKSGKQVMMSRNLVYIHSPTCHFSTPFLSTLFVLIFSIFILLPIALFKVRSFIAKKWRHTYWNPTNNLFGLPCLHTIYRLWLDLGVLRLAAQLFLNITWPILCALSIWRLLSPFWWWLDTADNESLVPRAPKNLTLAYVCSCRHCSYFT